MNGRMRNPMCCSSVLYSELHQRSCMSLSNDAAHNTKQNCSTQDYTNF